MTKTMVMKTGVKQNSGNNKNYSDNANNNLQILQWDNNRKNGWDIVFRHDSLLKKVIERRIKERKKPDRPSECR